MPGEFLDSNILLYLLSTDQDKADRAEQLLAQGLLVSAQVLNEAANVARRKFGRSWPEIGSWLAQVRSFLTIRPITEATHIAALRLVDRYALQWWDALIVAAALEADCDVLYSEDMHHGLIVDGRLTIINPFRA